MCVNIKIFLYDIVHVLNLLCLSTLWRMKHKFPDENSFALTHSYDELQSMLVVLFKIGNMTALHVLWFRNDK